MVYNMYKLSYTILLFQKMCVYLCVDIKTHTLWAVGLELKREKTRLLAR